MLGQLDELGRQKTFYQKASDWLGYRDGLRAVAAKQRGNEKHRRAVEALAQIAESAATAG